MRFVPLGVRGSTAAPGSDFVRWGGHTSCLAVYRDGEQSPFVVLDAGTGLRELPALLDRRPYRGDIVLSHLHWDHAQGLPFCPAVDNPNAQVRLFLPVPAWYPDAERTLASAMSPPHFPIGPDGLLGEWRFERLRPGRVNDEVTAAAVPHKGGEAYGIRVAADDAVLAYLPDHALHAGTDPAQAAASAEFVRGADVLVHDGQYVAAEQQIAAAYGHATIEAAAAFADRAGVGALVLTHHAPTRTDDELDALAAHYTRTPCGRSISFARQLTRYPVNASPTL